jgi:hypothetical protein
MAATSKTCQAVATLESNERHWPRVLLGTTSAGSTSSRCDRGKSAEVVTLDRPDGCASTCLHGRRCGEAWSSTSTWRRRPTAPPGRRCRPRGCGHRGRPVRTGGVRARPAAATKCRADHLRGPRPDRRAGCHPARPGGLLRLRRRDDGSQPLVARTLERVAREVDGRTAERLSDVVIPMSSRHLPTISAAAGAGRAVR